MSSESTDRGSSTASGNSAARRSAVRCTPCLASSACESWLHSAGPSRAIQCCDSAACLKPFGADAIAIAGDLHKVPVGRRFGLQQQARTRSCPLGPRCRLRCCCRSPTATQRTRRRARESRRTRWAGLVRREPCSTSKSTGCGESACSTSGDSCESSAFLYAPGAREFFAIDAPKPF